MALRPARSIPEGGSEMASDEEAPKLLEACKAGDNAAFRRLFSARAGQVYRWALFLGLGPADAEDVAQEALATAARRIDSCRAEEALTSWLYQITRKLVANARRRSWFRKALSLSSPEDSQAPAFEHEASGDIERELAIRACLEKLPRAQAEVLVLLEVEGFTRDEVAQMLRLPAGTVASRLRLAREAFRTHWEHAGNEPLPASAGENS